MNFAAGHHGVEVSRGTAMNCAESAKLIIRGMDGTISAQTVTYLQQMMEGATKLKCSEFGDAVIKHMD